MMRMKVSGSAIRRLAAAAALAGLVTACSAPGGNPGTGSGASCAAALRFGGRVYIGTSLRTQAPFDRIGEIPPSHLRRLGTGTMLACRDANHGNGTPARRVRAARITGVSPATAIASRDDGRVYLAPGARVPRRLAAAPWVRWNSP